MDAKKIIQKLKGEETTRGRVTLYLDKALYKDFQKACQGLSPSRTIEELMREFVDSAHSEKSKK